ncbi:MAG: diguanylate cyclase [Clostridiales bacterium]|nr:diguanylate cyclase [Clostridiales bacterium]
MLIKNTIIYLTMILMLTVPVYADFDYLETELDIERTFEWLDRESGISNMSISSIFQDKYGFIWFGTQGGLNRYDGNEVITFRNNPFDKKSLENNLIQTMYYDESAHEIWLGTYQGVSHFVIESESFTNYTVESIGLSDTVVTAIEKNADGNMWFGTLNGLNLFNPKTNELIKYDIPENTVRDLEITSEGILYIGTYDGLYYFDAKKLHKYDVELSSPYVMTVKEFKKGILTLGLWDGGVVVLDLEENITKDIHFDDDRVYCLTESSDGVLWVGTWGGGLFTIEPDGSINNFSGTKNINDISHPVVYSLLEDDSNIMWIGTNGGGVSIWNPRKKNFVAFRHDPEDGNSISHGKVNVIKEIDGNLYFGLYDQGLNIYNTQTKEFSKYMTTEESNSLHNNSVNDIIVFQEEIIIATNRGLTLFDSNAETFTKWDLVDEDTIVYALEVYEDVLWLGTYGDGIYQYNSNTKLLTHKDSGNSKLSDDIIYDIHMDKNEQLWIGTNNGLNLINADTGVLSSYKNDDSDFLPSHKIQMIYEDSVGDLWFGSSGGGITHLNNRTLAYVNYTEQDGLSSNDVLSILEDENNHFWVSTNDGISLINTTTEEILNYTPDDGIGGWEFSRGRLKSSTGQLFFGGVHGVTEIPSTLNPVESKAPRVYITNISSIDQELKPSLKIYNDKSIEIGANISYIAIDVVAIEFDAPRKTSFSYKLEGHDNEWIHLGNNKRISYSNLPPGEYVLKVQVQSASNLLSSVEKLELIILTPWYRTLPMYGIYFVIILVLINTIFKLRQSKLIKKKNAELSDLNNRLEEMNTTLEQLSNKDPLTGVYNRRYFKVELEENLLLAQRSRTSIAVLMVDLDDFKHINDTYGHLEGDRLLIQLCQKIQSILSRKTDFISRYGGDEFSIVLYDTDLAGALSIANKIISLGAENFEISDETQIFMPLSIGLVALIPSQSDTLESVLKQADDMLYKAKESGKNRVCYE